jgi:acyl-coenzyme A thioesterase 13
MAPLPPDDPRRAMFATHGFDRCLDGVTLEEIEEGRATAKLVVAEHLQNWGGTLHGGAIATIVDNVGTVAIMSRDRDGRPGVTTDLNVTYLRAAPAGSTVLVEAICLKAGRTLAFVEVELKTPNGQLLAQGRMTKYLK